MCTLSGSEESISRMGAGWYLGTWIGSSTFLQGRGGGLVAGGHSETWEGAFAALAMGRGEGFAESIGAVFM